MSLNTPIARLPRIQPQIAKKFLELGLVTLYDALFWFPFRHQDWRRQAAISEVHAGDEVTLAVTMSRIVARRAWRRRGTTIIDATVSDDRGDTLHVVWFNIPFLVKSLKIGDRVFLSGKIGQAKDGRLQLNNPVYERPTNDPLHQKLIPVYRSTAGLSQRQLRLVMKQAVALANALPDYLSATTAAELGLVSLSQALTDIHFPPTPTAAAAAVQRLKFDELFAWHLRITADQDSDRIRNAQPVPFHEEQVRSFVQALPFSLTNDQRLAAWQVLQDMTKSQPMSRLIQGDVGSGKTVVAALVAYNSALSHHQVALIAPTLVLAEQHWTTFVKTLGNFDVPIALVTGQEAKIYRSGQIEVVSRATVRQAIAAGELAIVLGTHAILDPEIVWPSLVLVIVDEQHRFGVIQRGSLLAHHAATPHFLSLTATPIPRSFALWLSGILTVSTIIQKPAGRQPITSMVITSDQRSFVDTMLRDTRLRNEQAFVVTPLIEESDSLGVHAATIEYERLVKALPNEKIGLLHGALPANDRLSQLEAFRRGETGILVTTTVIEVGVDVPNATLMVIEDADRFGLAQLHQLRGRVGRGNKKSTCLLVTNRSELAVLERLNNVAAITDGFTLAELDYELRGGGDLYGQRQSGLPAWKLASLDDRELFSKVTTFSRLLETSEREQYRQAVANLQNTPGSFHPE